MLEKEKLNFQFIDNHHCTNSFHFYRWVTFMETSRHFTHTKLYKPKTRKKASSEIHENGDLQRA